jgi:hypothetical protein
MEINYEDLNEKHCRGVDKWYRMCGGLASKIISYGELTIELEIRISQRWPKDPTTTAIQLSKCWREFNDCLKDARFYKVTLIFLNPNQDMGGIIKISRNQDMQLFTQAAQDLCQKMNSPGENQSILLTGIIDDNIQTALQ